MRKVTHNNCHVSKPKDSVYLDDVLTHEELARTGFKTVGYNGIQLERRISFDNGYFMGSASSGSIPEIVIDQDNVFVLIFHKEMPEPKKETKRSK